MQITKTNRDQVKSTVDVRLTLITFTLNGEQHLIDCLGFYNKALIFEEVREYLDYDRAAIRGLELTVTYEINFCD